MTSPRHWIFDNPVQVQPDTQGNEQIAKQLRRVVATAHKSLAKVTNESAVLHRSTKPEMDA